MRRGTRGIHYRLAQLEQICASVARASAKAVNQGSCAVEELRDRLREYGFEPQGNESLAEATARALGISCAELKVRLRSGSLGIGMVRPSSGTL